MKVKYIKTKGFRKFKNIFETDLYDITSITGKNRSGKSNILYAIVNIILGTNLSGNEKTCLINKDCDDSYGEIRFIDNQGIEHTLIRIKDKYSSKRNFLYLDGNACKQEELMSFYKDKKLFLSIINPLYFLNKSPAEQKEMVDKYLSDVKPKVIFDKLTINEQNKLINKYYNNKSKTYRELSAEEQEEFINLNMLNICMDIAYNNLSKSEQKILEGVPSNIPKYISELNSDIKRTENTIVSLDGKIEYAKKIANDNVPKYKSFEKEEELLLVRQELSFLSTNKEIVDKENQKKIIEKLEKEVLSKETECNELENSMKIGKQKYLSIKNGITCTCPTCEQKIQDESKNITIQNMKNELVAFYDKKI